MYYIYGQSGPALFIESTDSMIIIAKCSFEVAPVRSSCKKWIVVLTIT